MEMAVKAIKIGNTILMSVEPASTMLNPVIEFGEAVGVKKEKTASNPIRATEPLVSAVLFLSMALLKLSRFNTLSTFMHESFIRSELVSSSRHVKMPFLSSILILFIMFEVNLPALFPNS